MPSNPSIVAALSELHHYAPIEGACLQIGNGIAANHMPFSDAKTRLLCTAVQEMCSGYASVGRQIDEYYFGYDRGHLLIFSREQVRLVLYASLKAELDPIVDAARRFLDINAAMIQSISESELTQRIAVQSTSMALSSCPEVFAGDPPLVEASRLEPTEEESRTEQWMSFREEVHQLVTPVLGDGQSERTIERALKEHGYGASHPPLEVDFRSVASAIVEKIPNRSRRRSVQSQIEELLRARQL